MVDYREILRLHSLGNSNRQISFEEHMTPEHRKYLRYNADDFRMWAKNIVPNTEKVIEYFLAKEQEPEQGYRSCASLRGCRQMTQSQRYIQHICTVAVYEVVLFAYRVAIPRQRFNFKNVFST